MQHDQNYILGKINISSLVKAKGKLKLALEAPSTELNRDAAVKRFEFTIELSWKAMKRILASRHNFINSPKPIIRESAKEGLLLDVSSWLEFLEFRNRTSHTYDENAADELYHKLPKFLTLVDHFISSAKALKEDD